MNNIILGLIMKIKNNYIGFFFAIFFIICGIIMLSKDLVGIGINSRTQSFSAVGGPLFILIGFIFLAVGYYGLSPYSRIRRFFEDNHIRKKERRSMERMRPLYSISVVLAGLFVVILIYAGSHGHFTLQNKATANSVLIFSVFLLSGISNLYTYLKGNKIPTGFNIALNLVGFVTLLKILLFMFGLNDNESFPMVFSLLTFMLLIVCMLIIRSDIKKILKSVNG